VGDRLSKLLAGLAVGVGGAAVLVGLSVFVEAWQTSRAWAGSAEAQHAGLPVEEPIWLDELPARADPTAEPSLQAAPTGLPRGPSIPTALQPPLPTVDGGGERELAGSAADPTVVGGRVAQPVPGAPRAVAESAAAASRPVRQPADEWWRGNPGSPPTRLGDQGAEVAVLPSPGTGAEGQQAAAEATPAGVEAAPVAFAVPADVQVGEVDFRFLDPPEPGAHARLAVAVLNRAPVPTGPVSLVIPSPWLRSFTVFGAVPGVLDDRAEGDGERRYVFGGLAPGEQRVVELHVLATAEEVDAPEVRVLLGDAAEIGRTRPRTVAPRPRPGPARAVTISKLGVRASVVQVPWEPPPFVIGQLQGTAAVSEGNTVLIGHLAGPAGDVFQRLDRLRPGDEVVATSRGQEYRFVVSEIAVRPYDDLQPTRPTDTPRLTLMTCTGQWSIARQDYSHRLWVVAEPPELAQQTIRANAERAAQAAREADEAAAARAAHEAEVSATAPAEPPAAPVTAPAADPASAGEASGGQATPASEPPESPGPVAAVEPGAPPTEPADPMAADTEAREPGIAIEWPTDGAAVDRRFAVRVRRAAEANARAPLWLVVRAEVPGSRWYALARPLEPAVDGTWTGSVELGGPAGVRHEIRIGVVDAAVDAALRRHAAERAGQPLDDLPPGFRTGARIVVERR
jgi:hypothetical protein